MIWTLLAIAIIPFIIYRKCWFSNEMAADDPAVASGLFDYIDQHGFQLSWRHSRRNLAQTTFIQIMRAFGSPAGDANERFATVWQHRFNIVLHALNGLLVYWFIATTEWTDPAIGALLFAVSPLAVNGVANIAGRYGVLAQTFSLLALISAVGGAWWLIPVFVACAVSSKQDSLIVVPVIGIIMLKTALFGITLSICLLVIGIILSLWKGKAFWQHLNLDHSAKLAKLGFETQLPLKEHFITHLNESVKRHLRWLVGYGYQADPFVEAQEPSVAVFACIAFVCMLVPFLEWPWRFALCLIILSPWWTYGIMPLPDLILEQRAYGTVFGIAIFQTLFLNLLPVPVLIVAVLWLASTATLRASKWSSCLEYNKMAYHDSADGKHKSRVVLNLGAMYWTFERNIEMAIALTKQALEQQPKLVPAMRNLITFFGLCGAHKETEEMQLRLNAASQL